MDKNLLAGACTAIVLLTVLNFFAFVKIRQLETKVNELEGSVIYVEDRVDAVSTRVDFVNESLNKQEEINKTLIEGTYMLYELLGFGVNQ